MTMPSAEPAGSRDALRPLRERMFGYRDMA